MSVRILYVGCYRDGGSGYARAAADNVSALVAAGAEVACRPVCFGPARPPVYPLLGELEAVRLPAADVLVQHVPPYAYVYCGDAGRNVGAFYFETRPLPPRWVNRACLMDALLFPSAGQAEDFAASPFAGPRPEVLPCPIPADPARYARSYRRVRRFEEFKAGGRFLFYTVGELVRRKNLSGLLRAYFSEFRAHEPVGLVVKASLAGKPAAAVARHADEICRRVADGMKLADTPPVFVVPDRLADDDLMALHLACDVFVQPSMGEGWSIPAFDAMAFGKTPIVTAAGGYREYLDDGTGWLVPGRREPVFAEGATHAELFTGRQTWVSPDPLRLAHSMRRAYEDVAEREDKAARGLSRALDFSYEAVGPKLLGLLAAGGRHEGRPPDRLDAGP